MDGGWRMVDYGLWMTMRERRAAPDGVSYSTLVMRAQWRTIRVPSVLGVFLPLPSSLLLLPCMSMQGLSSCIMLHQAGYIVTLSWYPHWCQLEIVSHSACTDVFASRRSLLHWHVVVLRTHHRALGHRTWANSLGPKDLDIRTWAIRTWVTRTWAQ